MGESITTRFCQRQFVVSYRYCEEADGEVPIKGEISCGIPTDAEHETKNEVDISTHKEHLSFVEVEVHVVDEP